ncbi:hypothetical protein [Allorhizobium taibaishanense]|uniref:Uncharacterized protein n=1 Tax=Allorhizobium taibaishanense TaxID=887144 RepID=A0A1Q9A3R2_9HYPH|nr:hypothetical protein [Allorhizobium taibaishanense]MBB4006258.1 hypothetical protein [Allorhizobium taibaishanense]OLP49235.1 hypothetical protein BJF91_19365 [Allorhizobium taibaishanense]
MADRAPTIDEIDNVDKLEAYLRTRPVEEAQVIAFRSALRIMPFLAQAAFLRNDIHLAGRLRVSAFRALFLCWADLRYRNEIADLQLNIDAAAVAADSSDVAAHNASVHTAALTLIDSARVSARAAASATYRLNIDSIHQAKRVLIGTIYAVGERPIVWHLVRHDLSIIANAGAYSLLQSPLWPGGEVPEKVKQADAAFWKDISSLGVEWTPIWDWYSHVKSGMLPFENLRGIFENVVTGLGQEGNEFWDRNPEVVMKDIFERLTLLPRQPPEPEPGPGPQYDIIDGKLSIVASAPLEDEITPQLRLFERLQRDVERLVNAADRIDNSHPNLAFSIREYGTLLDTSLAELDVTGVWSVGSSLAGFAQSFREQNRNRTLAEPLEPEVDGLLQSVIRQHGAFIMGFEEGRDLVDRADRFALDTETTRGLEESGNPLIAELASNADLVHDDTRAVHRSVNNYVQEFGWASGRVGYAAYLLVRNAVRVVIRWAVFYGFKDAVEGVSAASGFPSLKAAISFIYNFASPLLVFFASSPEMLAYVQWAFYITQQVFKSD